ncbi:hypothetical protein ACH5RR_006774 [Cinchona calisaya]|uniref:Uncharacterized protein n=1 Tax=Cinchona calisaya TaxID=153742 RepID=A0ABD3AQ95_9GENT
MLLLLLLCHVDTFTPRSGAKLNGYSSGHGFPVECRKANGDGEVQVIVPNLSNSLRSQSEDKLHHDYCGSCALRETLLSFITSGDDVEVSGSLSILATLLQTKGLDESMLDAFGILPQWTQHKKLLLQALVGEESGEEKLFSSKNNVAKDEISSELDGYARKLKLSNSATACHFFFESL